MLRGIPTWPVHRAIFNELSRLQDSPGGSRTSIALLSPGTRLHLVARTVVPTRTSKVTAPISQAIRVGDLVFVSGQVAVDPSTGQFTGGDAGAQTHQVLKNLAQALEGAGSSLAEVTKVTAFLTDMGGFDAFNSAYREHFRAPWPARSTIQVAGLAGPFEVEIEAIAVIGSAAEE